MEQKRAKFSSSYCGNNGRTGQLLFGIENPRTISGNSDAKKGVALGFALRSLDKAQLLQAG